MTRMRMKAPNENSVASMKGVQFPDVFLLTRRCQTLLLLTFVQKAHVQPSKELRKQKKGLLRRFLRPLDASQATHLLHEAFTFFGKSIGKSVKVRESEKGIIHMKHVT